MIQHVEMSSAYRELDEQIEFNSSQLRQLYAVYKADRLNMLLYSLLIVGLIALLCFFVVSFISPNLNRFLRPEIVEFSGVLSILTAFALIQLFRSFYTSWLRSGEIKMCILEQEIAISSANKVISKEETMNEKGSNYE